MREVVDWGVVRIAYESDPDPLDRIAARMGVHERSLRKRAARENWARAVGAPTGRGRGRVLEPASVRPGDEARAPVAADAADLVASLQRTAAHLVEAAERRYAGGGTEAIDEKELRTLTALAGMLAKVIALDPRSPRDPDQSVPAGPDIDVDDPRQRDAFSRRLEALAGLDPAGADERDDGGGETRARDLVAALRAGRPASA